MVSAAWITLCFLLGGFGYICGYRHATYTYDKEIDDECRARSVTSRPKIRPYGKAQAGKTIPKVNDDESAWRIENDL